MPNLIMLVGMPGSGKSTWRDNYVLDTHPHNILSTDDYIEMVAEEQGKTYNEVFKDEIKKAEEVLQNILKYSTGFSEDIIWDQTNLSVKSRKKKLAQIPKEYYKKAVVVLQTEEKIRSMNHKRKAKGRSLPDNILESMLKTFQFPTLEEGFDEIDIVYSKAE